MRRLRSPHGSQKDAVGKNLARIAHEKQEKVKFLRRQVNRLPRYRYAVGRRVDAEISRNQNLVSGALRRAAQMRSHARQQFLGTEWLGHIIISARIQRLNLHMILIANRENDDGRARGSANLFAQIDARYLRHHEIGDHQIRRPLGKGTQGLFRVVGGAHIVALRQKRRTQNTGDLRLIIDDKDSFRHTYDGVSSPIMEQDTAFGRIFFRYVLLTAVAGLLVYSLTHLRVNQTTVAFAFLLLVLLTAYRWRLAYSVYASILCTALYNFFFLPPVRRLTIADPQNWIALAGLLFTSVLVSHLSDRERTQAEASEARRRDVELLYRLSQRLLVQDDLKELARGTPSIVAAVFGFRAVALHVASTDAVYYSDPDQILVSSAELRSATKSTDEMLSTRNGIKFILLRLGMQHKLGLLATTDDGPTPEMYEAIGSLVSVALERAAALERSSRLEAARESERLRSALVDSVTHDLRTPLTAIRAAATTLQAQPTMGEAERSDLLAVVEEESARLDRLIGQAIEMAKLDSQSLRLELRAEDIRDLVDLTIENTHGRLQKHRIDVQIPDSLPLVMADRNLLERVLQHLLENAATYSSPGAPISVSARIEGDRLLFTVADQGPGISQEELPFVFDKYFRGRQQKNKTKGTGMGLAITRAIMRIHHGAITAESRPGEGAQFTFWIPFSPVTAQQSDVEASTDARGTSDSLTAMGPSSQAS